MGRPAAPRARVKVSLKIETVVEIVDAGYLGVTAAVEEHLAKADRTVNAWKWFVKKGAADPEEIRVRYKVISLTIIPEETS